MDAQYLDFYRKLNQSTSVFSDVLSVAKQARSLSEKSRNAIPHSEAISMVLKHDTKEVISDDSVIDEYESRYIKEMFSYIDDKDIKDAVYDSFYESKSNRNLLFIYNSIRDEHKQARVRILTRMLWHNLIRSDFSMEETKKRGRKRKYDTEQVMDTPIVETTEQIPEDNEADILAGILDVIESVPDEVDVPEQIEAEQTEVEPTVEATVIESTADVTPEVTETVKPKRTRAPREKKADPTPEKSASAFKVGDKITLPFARLFPSSVATQSMCVCTGEVEVLSDEIHDGRINVFSSGTNRKGWINISEIQ